MTMTFLCDKRIIKVYKLKEKKMKNKNQQIKYLTQLSEKETAKISGGTSRVQGITIAMSTEEQMTYGVERWR